MTTRKLIHMFVGVPDEMLRSIGMIAVLSARLDFIRIQLLEEADQVPLTRRPARDATGSGIGRPTGRGIGTGGPWWRRPAGDRARIGRRRVPGGTKASVGVDAASVAGPSGSTPPSDGSCIPCCGHD
jgi:hypothetical protein